MPTLWNRLEMRARSDQFDESLRNTLHDPYWTLCRQWQSGEFEATDNGSPAEVRLRWSSYPIRRYSLAGKAFAGYADHQPLEAAVERVSMQPGVPLRIEMGRHLLRLLREALGSAADSILEALRQRPELRFRLTEEGTAEARQRNAHLLSNRRLQSWMHAAVQSGALDGGALYAQLKSGKALSDFLDAPSQAADAVGADWMGWFETQYNQPDSEHADAWLPGRLEYQFEVEATGRQGTPVRMGAEEYYEGRMDWYSFAYSARAAETAPPADAAAETNIQHRIPAQVEYPGMPGARWWEMEDAQVNLLTVETGDAQSGRLALMEFGLMYSNDWFVLPLRVPAGALLDVQKLDVRDVFGQWSSVKHYRQADDPVEWVFFGLSGRDASPAELEYLFLPPSVVDLKESRPTEEVYLARDEMANMVWGIEHHIPDGVDGAREGNAAALNVATYLQNLSDERTAGAEPPPLSENEAQVKYTLATRVPEYWIPFMPVQMENGNGAIWLQRAAMPRVYPGLKIERVRPRTSLLRQGLDQADWAPYFLFEEEVPRSGIRVMRTWQRARWHQGRVALWSGYRKQNGRGQGSSGLRFDILVEKE